ncbi:hypothetical protein C8R42DRAFT_637962 [Lentinula raphanica]|nr:hypothetical protein C8R42DRAFT_637962 [Lentinula raphanica]
MCVLCQNLTNGKRLVHGGEADDNNGSNNLEYDDLGHVRTIAWSDQQVSCLSGPSFPPTPSDCPLEHDSFVGRVCVEDHPSPPSLTSSSSVPSSSVTSTSLLHSPVTWPPAISTSVGPSSAQPSELPSYAELLASLSGTDTFENKDYEYATSLASSTLNQLEQNPPGYQPNLLANLLAGLPGDGFENNDAEHISSLALNSSTQLEVLGQTLPEIQEGFLPSERGRQLDFVDVDMLSDNMPMDDLLDKHRHAAEDPRSPNSMLPCRNVQSTTLDLSSEALSALHLARTMFITQDSYGIPNFLSVIKQHTVDGSRARFQWAKHVDELGEALRENEMLPEAPTLVQEVQLAMEKPTGYCEAFVKRPDELSRSF